MASQDKIIFYTNHNCPWAHRAQIALAELNIPYEEQQIDLSVPRTPEYLAVNPRGQVPTLSFNGEIITESAIIAQFLVDKQPSHLVPTTGTPEGALRRARIARFVDTFIAVSSNHLFKLPLLKTDAEVEETAELGVAQIVQTVEPLLADAKPFFSGSETLTLAEVLTAPFALRLFTLSKANVFPAILAERLTKEAPNFTKWSENLANHPSVTKNYNVENIIKVARVKIAQARAA